MSAAPRMIARTAHAAGGLLGSLFGEGDELLVAGAIEQDGLAENLSYSAAGGGCQLPGNFVTIEQAAFLKLDLDQFMGGQRLIERSKDSVGQILAANHDRWTKGVAKAAKKAGLFSCQDYLR